MGKPYKDKIAGIQLKSKNSAFRQIFGIYCSNAFNKNLEFTLDEKMFRSLTKGDCHYCGIKPSNIKNCWNDKYIYNGIDRVDNCKGYVLSNCVSCCSDCNLAKKNNSTEKFLEWIRRISNFQK